MRVFDRDDGLFEMREKDEDGQWEPAINWPLFTRIEGAIGWLDPTGTGMDSRPWGVVAGKQEDGRLVFLEEVTGATLDAVLRAMVDLKDRYLLRRIYVNDLPGHIPTCHIARQYPGLTHYPGYTNMYNKFQLTLPVETWEHFRTLRTKAAIISAGELLLGDMLGGLDRLKQLMSEGKVGIRADCPKIESIKTAKPPFQDLVKQPAVQAAIYLAHNMTKGDYKRNPAPKEEEQRSGYPNFQRER